MSDLTEGQISWDERLLFDGRTLVLSALEGWDDLPGIDSGNVVRPGRHGAWGGRHLARQRVVTATGVLAGGPAKVGDVESYIADVRRITALSEGTRQRPLAIRIGGQTFEAYGQVTARTISGGAGYRAGRPAVVVQWTCPDPRRYRRRHEADMDAPTASTDGLDYPLAYPLDYGDPLVGGAATLHNGGDTGAHPVLTITGPCDRPRVTNRATGTSLEFGLTIAEGNTLTVDCDAGTVRLNGADRFFTLTPDSVPPEQWVISPGSNPLQFRPVWSEAGSTATIRWRDAYL